MDMRLGHPNRSEIFLVAERCEYLWLVLSVQCLQSYGVRAVIDGKRFGLRLVLKADLLVVVIMLHGDSS